MLQIIKHEIKVHYMKRKISIFAILLVLSFAVVLQSCLDREPVPYVEQQGFTVPMLVAPANGVFLSVSGTTVDLKWSSEADGDPQKWDIYFGPSEEPAKVKTGHTSQTYTVTVEKGRRYYWRVVGYDANNIPSRSEIWSFEVINPDAPLKLNMDWTTNVKEAIGLDVDPKTAANLRLKILNQGGTVVQIVNTTGFEEYSFLSTMPDGVYYVAADLASTINAGDFNKPLNIDVRLNFYQRGILSQVLPYPSIMTNENPCDLYSVVLAKVTKTGSTYTVAQDVTVISPSWTAWNGEDALYPSEVTASPTCTGYFLKMLNKGWMNDWWGEIIVKGGQATALVDAAGNVTIPYQYYCTTTYNGATQPDYYIQGTGTLNKSGTYPVMTLHYDLKQGSTWIGHYCYVNYGWDQDGFDAVITTDPNGKGSKGVIAIPPRPNR